MASLNDLTRQHTSLTRAQRRHLRRLVGSWGLVADLSFADLLLMVPIRSDNGELLRFVVVGQVRPATAQTLFRDDQVGRFYGVEDQPLALTALERGEIARADKAHDQDQSGGIEEGVTAVVAVPVRCEGEVVAVLSSEARAIGRSRSKLEVTFRSVGSQILDMVSNGLFPFGLEEAESELAPRVGDGAIVLDSEAKVTYTSPNAVSALHRMGFHANAIGREIGDLGFHRDALRTAFRLRVPISEEVERGTSVTIMFRLLPLLDGAEINGAILLLRDVSDLRRQERLLVSMDATLREIHHRVKNNLQTVSSLLRLQGRRVEAPEAKSAIDEAVRRIKSIALVHELLAQEGGDDVEFGEIIRPIVAMVEEALVAPDSGIEFRIVGEGPVMPAATASSMAVVLTELLQNAVEHGYPPGSDGGLVTIEIETHRQEMMVRVHDDGVGLPESFELETCDGLGLTIARTLATGELGGEISLRPAARADSPVSASEPPLRGTTAELRVCIARAQE